MIEFSCIYCGRSIQADEERIDQQVQCPACGHSVRLCERRPDSATEAVPEERAKKAKRAAFWAAKSNQEIAKRLLRPRRVLTEEERQWRADRQMFSFLIPHYDDLTLFALALSFVLLWLINPEVQRDLIGLLTSEWSRGGVMVFLTVIALAAIAGMALSLVNVFLRRAKSGLEKCAMLTFAIAVTAGTGFYAGARLWAGSKGWLLVFPAWNILNGCLLTVVSLTIVDTTSITDEPASLGELVITVLCVLVLQAVCQYFELHWAVTYSVAVAYTMSLHNGIRATFGGRRPTTGIDPGR
jgi:DNA-directed RNA polymerase subunit RPC12/RpoP